ncbi:DUF1579 family protein [Allosphingosinicella flava]|uniref:DUF1579 family protein n=1 Tax=Allosphingosinicella flava TaxID=2771430 RepID=A0A7T2GLI2_9SPHN|nr:DUF1579 family protein [Sphingosinicella flava]QPQ56022.1 DUF1579 family protein [Sphingosinicella flava]
MRAGEKRVGSWGGIMKKIAIWASALALACSLGTAASAQTAPAAAPAPDRVAEFKAFMADAAGTWDADITFPSQEAGKPDQKAKGVMKRTLKSAGMWLLDELAVDGTPYQGTAILGFDSVKNEMVGVWTDNNMHNMRLDKGRWDAEKKKLTWHADVPGLIPGTYNRYLFSEEVKGPDIREFKSVALFRTGEVPMVHIIFTRRKN